MAGGESITWQVMGPSNWRGERDGLKLKFPLSGRPPTEREAKRIVANALITCSEAWIIIKPKIWILDLDKLKEKFELKLDWLNGCIEIEPDYDIEADVFDPEKLAGSLSIVIEKDDLAISLEPRWGEYPDDDLAELVPLLRRKALDRDLGRVCKISVTPTSILMMDIDLFKKVNDTCGHLVGDDVLVRVAEIMRDIVGRRGSVYRYGGEELTGLLPGFTALEAKALAERIRTGVEAERWSVAPDLQVTVSIGISELQPGHTPEELIRQADEALYKCKREGRNRIVIWE